MTVTLSRPTTTVDVTPLRPLHVLELARLALDHPELTAGSDLATYVCTRRWAMHLVAHRPQDTRAYLVTDLGRPVGVAVLDEIRRGPADIGDQVGPGVVRAVRHQVHGPAASAHVGRQVRARSELGMVQRELGQLKDVQRAQRRHVHGGGRRAEGHGHVSGLLAQATAERVTYVAW